MKSSTECVASGMQVAVPRLMVIFAEIVDARLDIPALSTLDLMLSAMAYLLLPIPVEAGFHGKAACHEIILYPAGLSARERMERV